MKRKITIFEAHMQEKMHFTAFLLFSFPIEDGTLQKTGAKKSLLKSNLECWQNGLWMSLAFHCFSLFLLWFFIGFCASHWFFPGCVYRFSLVLNKFHVLVFAYHCFCSLIFISFFWCFSLVFVFCSLVFICCSAISVVFFIIHSCFFSFFGVQCFFIIFFWVFIGFH